ncbi:MAG: hypothetical protein IJO32_02905 [Bacilli bacterium]|nr:hypothetical protein [Bacilli bacterium]
MKKKKIIIIISIILIIIGIISYGIINFILDYKNSKKEMEQNTNIINDEFETFKAEVDEFSLIRDEIYENILNQIYYETFENNIDAWNNKFVEYGEIITNITKFDKLLGEKCLNKTYLNTSINQKCEIFIETYEIALNSYITDIELYNEHIEKYNEWKLKNNNTDGTKTIEKFNSDINEYIDYNKDNEYLGKE